MNHKVGMTAKIVSTKTEFALDSENEFSTKLVKTTSTETILKVVGTKTYSLVVEKNAQGKLTISVKLEERAMNFQNDFSNVVSAKVEGRVVTMNFSETSRESGSVTKLKGVMTKDLKSPSFCNYDSKMNGSYLNREVSTNSFKLKFLENSTCSKTLSIEAVKKLNLKKVEFCDFTISDNAECVVKDMSFLTATL